MTIYNLFKLAIEKNASDLHLVVGKPPVLRINGELFLTDKEILTPEAVENLVFELLQKEQKEKFVRDRELDFAYSAGKDARFRINLHWEKGNIGLAARLIPSLIPAMKDLLLPPVVQKFTLLPHGLILVTGPTGCGKSTTLASMIEDINKTRKENIVTLEDPIEYIFKPKNSIIRQRQLGADMLSFKEGLRHALRQDPNVIMVGEMRDLDTVSAALTLAETGHLVFATLHTYSAAQTIDRLIDVFPPHQQTQIRMQLALSLRGVISQQLLPRVGGGRIAAREIMVSTPAVANLIRENKVPQIKTVIQTNARLGMVTLEQDLERLQKEKLITKEDAEALIINPK